MKNYILIFSLFFTSCSQSDEAIADIPEASGICYSKNSDSLFVANDEGKVYEIDKKGKILRKKYLGNYDLEGVACDDNKGKLYFAVEGVDNILIVNQKNLIIQREINIKRKFKNELILRPDKKNGLEGITLTPKGIYLSNQAKPSVLIKLKNIKKKKASIIEVINHKLKDIAGLSYYKGFLYMLSDQDNLLIKYDIKNNIILNKKPLYDRAWEGITFDSEGNIYLADDNGKIYRLSKGTI